MVLQSFAKKMKNNSLTVCIMVFDLSDNAIVRTFPFAKILAKRYKVKIIGPILGKEIYTPYADEFEYQSIELVKNKNKLFTFILLIKKIFKAIDGDVIFAFKPKITSFGVALLAKLVHKIPIILDIEDFETAGFYEANFRKKFSYFYSQFDLNNELLNLLMEYLVFIADKKIVVSSFLKKKFGGTIIRHGPDTNIFDPNKYNRGQNRIKFKLEEKVKYILFSGYPREHKGINELIKAVKNLNRPDLKLLIVGGDRDKTFLNKLLNENSKFVSHHEAIPHKDMPQLLSAIDIIVIPQRKTLFSNAQVPAKVFEAMAMCKPIIATDVSDLSKILKGCGIVIKPSPDTKILEENISLILNDYKLNENIGNLARKKCVFEYSWEAMERKLFPIFDKINYK
tara:strand:- start:1680 stop:2867 length:1188 start_codon:yes stop_codon:yes gene_type:complete